MSSTSLHRTIIVMRAFSSKVHVLVVEDTSTGVADRGSREPSLEDASDCLPQARPVDDIEAVDADLVRPSAYA